MVDLGKFCLTSLKVMTHNVKGASMLYYRLNSSLLNLSNLQVPTTLLTLMLRLNHWLLNSNFVLYA